MLSFSITALRLPVVLLAVCSLLACSVFGMENDQQEKNSQIGTTASRAARILTAGAVAMASLNSAGGANASLGFGPVQAGTTDSAAAAAVPWTPPVQPSHQMTPPSPIRIANSVGQRRLSTLKTSEKRAASARGGGGGFRGGGRSIGGTKNGGGKSKGSDKGTVVIVPNAHARHHQQSQDGCCCCCGCCCD